MTQASGYVERMVQVQQQFRSLCAKVADADVSRITLRRYRCKDGDAWSVDKRTWSDVLKEIIGSAPDDIEKNVEAMHREFDQALIEMSSDQEKQRSEIIQSLADLVRYFQVFVESYAQKRFARDQSKAQEFTADHSLYERIKMRGIGQAGKESGCQKLLRQVVTRAVSALNNQRRDSEFPSTPETTVFLQVLVKRKELLEMALVLLGAQVTLERRDVPQQFFNRRAALIEACSEFQPVLPEDDREYDFFSDYTRWCEKVLSQVIAFHALVTQEEMKEDRTWLEAISIIAHTASGLRRHLATRVMASLSLTSATGSFSFEKAKLGREFVSFQMTEDVELERLMDKLRADRGSPLFAEFDWKSFDSIQAAYEMLEHPVPSTEARFAIIEHEVRGARAVLKGRVVDEEKKFSQWLRTLSESRVKLLQQFDVLMETCKTLVADVQRVKREGAYDPCEVQTGNLLGALLGSLQEFQTTIANAARTFQQSHVTPRELAMARQQLSEIKKQLGTVQTSIDEFRQTILAQQLVIQKIMFTTLTEASHILPLPQSTPSWWNAANELYSQDVGHLSANEWSKLQKGMSEMGPRLEQWRTEVSSTIQRFWSDWKDALERAVKESSVAIQVDIPQFAAGAPGSEDVMARQLMVFKENCDDFQSWLTAEKEYRDLLVPAASEETARGWICKQVSNAVSSRVHPQQPRIVLGGQDVANGRELLKKIQGAVVFNDKEIDFARLKARYEALCKAVSSGRDGEQALRRLRSLWSQIFRPSELSEPVSVEALALELRERLADFEQRSHEYERQPA